MTSYKGLSPVYELELFQKGYDKVIGIDEVGRGSWAGPLVIAGYIFSKDTNTFSGVNDSKKVSKKARENLSEHLKESTKIIEVSVEIIDEIGVGKATEYGVNKIIEKFSSEKTFFLLDGQFPNIKSRNLKTIIDGDAKIYSIACASIVAKVYRDKLMNNLAKSYSNYGFERNVGYGTKTHLEAIKKFGVTDIHRKSYKPIKDLMA